MIKVCSCLTNDVHTINRIKDMEYEEERGCSGKEEAQDECRPN